MKTSSLIQAAPLLATSAYAVVYSQLSGSGSAPPEAPVLFETAARNPNATSFVDFNEALSGTDNDNNQWQWRVNITNVAVPNATVPFPGESPAITPDPHVVYTTYDLTWPGPSKLNSQLEQLQNQSNGNTGSDSLNICAYLITGDWKDSVNKAYKSSDNGDCSGALGKQCVQTVLGGTGSGSSTGCPAITTLSNLDGCEETLNSGSSLQAFSFEIGNSTVRPNTTAISPDKGDAFAYFRTDALPVSNTTNYDAATQELQILMLSLGGQKQLLCQRLSEEATNVGGSSSSGSTPTSALSSGSGTTSATPSASSSSGAMPGSEMHIGLGMAGLAGLTVWFSLS